MKKNFLVIALLFIFTGIVKAETITYELCKSGCTYSSYDDILTDIKGKDLNTKYDFVVNIRDNETYEATVKIPHYVQNVGYPVKNQSTFKVNGVKGSEPTIKGTEKYFYIGFGNHTEINNVNIEGDYCETEYGDSKQTSSTKITNSTLDCNFVSLNTKNVEVDNIRFDGTQFFAPFISENVIVKNSNIKGTGFEFNQNEWHPGVRFDSNNVQIINTTIRSDGLWDDYYSEVLIKDSTITLDNGFKSKSDKLTIKNSTITAPKGVEKFGLLDFDNATIKVNSQVGLRFVNGSGVIKNSNISGAKEYGIEYIADSFANKFNLKIDNTDLTNNTNSLHLKTAEVVCRFWDEATCDYYTNDYQEKNPLYKYGIMVNVWMTNSKIKNIKAEDGGVVYVGKTNHWSSKPKRANSFDKGNVVELTKGKVIYEESNTGILKLNVDKEVNLNTYFEDLGEVLGDWIIEDSSIVKIVNGKIIPLKVGTTTITAHINNTYYVLGVTVTEDMLNPETKDILISLVVILFIITGGFILLQYKKVKEIK